MPANLILPAILMLLAGAATAVQAPTNAMLAKASGSVLLAAFISFLIGTFALAALTVGTQPRVEWAPMRSLPWYAWVGGFYGALFVAAAAFAAPRLGVASLITIAVLGQMITALAIDRFGLLGVPATPLSMGRLLGALLVVVGVVLVRRF